MTTDKKQPPDTDRPVLALVRRPGIVDDAPIDEWATWAYDERIDRWRERSVHGGTSVGTSSVIDWKERAILDRYDEEWEEWEARSDRFEEERDKALRAVLIQKDTIVRAFEDRDRAEAERDELGCQLEALRAVQRDDVADLRTRVAAIEKWRADVEADDRKWHTIIAETKADDEKGGA